MAPLRDVSTSASPQLLAQRGDLISSGVDEIPLLNSHEEATAAVASSTAPSRPSHCYAEPPPFEEHYKLRKRVLGTGASGGVLEAECRRTRRRVAVKSHRKEEMTDKQLNHMRSELEIHSSLAHPYIVKMLGFYESETTVRLVMERLRGGELFDRVLAEGPLPERVVARAAKQLLQAVAYLHDQHVVHRDIKLENLVYGESHKEHIKLIDFGFATRLDSSASLSQKCGTVGYAAPEVFSGRPYTEKVDIWSVGSVIYIMLTAKPLFGGDEPKMLKKNKAGKVDFSKHFKSLPKDTQLFVRQLLSVDPLDRPDARKALQHPWFQRMASEEAVDEEAMGGLFDDMEDAENVEVGPSMNTQQAACGVESLKDLALKVLPLGIVTSY